MSGKEHTNPCAESAPRCRAFTRTPRQAAEADGFTLVELLVVILIIGILAAVAIPAFVNQKGKAVDAAAKVQVRTGELAADTYATDHDGEYKGMTVAELQKIEPALKAVETVELSIVGTPTSNEFTVESTVKTGPTYNVYKITHTKAGEIKRECSTAGTGACPPSGSW